MGKEQIKVWISKYALTQGVFAVDAEIVDDEMISYPQGDFCNYAHGNDWHRTQEAAVARAEEMRQAKIASLQKSIRKLESLRFVVQNDSLEKTDRSKQ